MKVVTATHEWRYIRQSLQGSLGFVPTMGALHDGHRSLIRLSQEQSDYTIVSIFVNPTQFDDQRDLDAYPSHDEEDRSALAAAGIDFLFLPDFETIYPDNYRFKIVESEFSKQLCGASRPGHFEGVLTVVMRLLNIVQPDAVFLGEKDYQQFLLIRDMVSSFAMDIDVIPGPTIRDSDGVALSSRNARLSPNGHSQAAVFASALQKSRSLGEARSQLEEAGIDIDYVEELDGRRYGAVYIEGVRLIDNVPLASPRART